MTADVSPAGFLDIHPTLPDVEPSFSVHHVIPSLKRYLLNESASLAVSNASLQTV